MRALTRCVWRYFCRLFGAPALLPAAPWPDVDDYVKKLQVIENGEENSIMLHSISTTPLINTVNYPAPSNTIGDSQRSVLIQVLMDFEKICKAISTFLKTASREDVHEMHTAITSIDGIAYKSY